MYKANLSIPIDIQINLSSCGTSGLMLSLYGLSWDLLGTKNVSSMHVSKHITAAEKM